MHYRSSNTLVTHSSIQKIYVMVSVTEAATLELRLFQNKRKITAYEQIPHKTQKFLLEKSLPRCQARRGHNIHRLCSKATTSSPSIPLSLACTKSLNICLQRHSTCWLCTLVMLSCRRPTLQGAWTSSGFSFPPLLIQEVQSKDSQVQQFRTPSTDMVSMQIRTFLLD